MGLFEKKFSLLVIIVIMMIAVTGMLSAFVTRMFINPPVTSKVDEDEARSPSETVIQVNVLNGCGQPGIAAEVKDYLRERGFDVVEIGNADVSVDKSYIRDCVGDPGSARNVAYAVGVHDSRIQVDVDSSLFLRASIILGNDFRQLKPFN
ncbi:MAG: LytR C-terminal domain-containing protein [Candidatus Kapaibacterium sp.]